MPQAQTDIHSINILKQILRFITYNSLYIHNMPCYFVSSGVEIPMTNQTFDFIWNGLATKNSLTAKHLHLKKATKQTHPLTRTPMLNGESRRTDTTTENRTTKSISKDITKRKRNNRVCVCAIWGSATSL